MSNTSEYKAGLAAGTNDTVAMSALEMSSYSKDFALGYTVGHSYTVSVLHASSFAAATTAGDLARTYILDLGLICDKLDFDDEERRMARSAYDSSYDGDDDIDDEEENH